MRTGNNRLARTIAIVGLNYCKISVLLSSVPASLKVQVWYRSSRIRSVQFMGAI